MEQSVESILNDPAVVALCALYGFKVTPFRKASGDVSFAVEGDVSSVVADILANKLVGISDFLRHLRTVKTAIHTLKGCGSGGGNGN